MRLVLALCSLLLAQFISVDAAATYHVTVDANEELCFFEELQVNDPLGMSFQVTFGGFLDIDVTVCGVQIVCVLYICARSRLFFYG